MEENEAAMNEQTEETVTQTTGDNNDDNEKQIDPIEARLAEIEAKYQRELKRLEHGIGKSIGKLRQRNRALEEVIAKLVPEPSAVQFKSEDERKAYEAYAKPIIDDIKNKQKEMETLEHKDEMETIRASLVEATINGLSQLPDAQEIMARYQQAIQAGQEYDLDDDILSFAAHNPSLLRVLYANPQQIPQLKRMPQNMKAAAIMALLAQSLGSANNIPQMAATKSVAPTMKPTFKPAMPPQGGANKGDPEEALDGDDYLRWFRSRKSKGK